MISFVKAHGNGNDFIIIENKEGTYSDDRLSDLAKKICRRKTSLGADGVLVLEGSKTFDFYMRLFNADGSEGEMCGNGARCIARYAFEKGHAKSDMTFETKAGPLRASVNPPWATIDMGEIDVSNLKEGKINAFGKEIPYMAFYVGVPHCVLFFPGFRDIPRDSLLSLARHIRRKGTIFDEGANVNFAERNKDCIVAMTYERGVEDFTLSCGTGSIACCLASHLLFGSPLAMKVKNPGGVNKVALRLTSEKVFEASLSGKALIVAEGLITEEALSEEEGFNKTSGGESNDR